MGSVDTTNLAYTEIDDILFQNLSNPNFSNAFISTNDKDTARLEKVSFTSTIETIEKSLDLMADFMFNSKFDNKKRIIELLRMKKSYFESGMYDNGHILAINRANSHIDKNTMIKDELSGIGSYLFIKKAIDQAQNDFKGFVSRLDSICLLYTSPSPRDRG